MLCYKRYWRDHTTVSHAPPSAPHVILEPYHVPAYCGSQLQMLACTTLRVLQDEAFMLAAFRLYPPLVAGVLQRIGAYCGRNRFLHPGMCDLLQALPAHIASGELLVALLATQRGCRV